ncbi:uncharacterized protein LOC134473073 [Cavia porcellus]|uniref:uncharacterized protein LOC134473073 n=1 Tax=Cavia porcellus TaxID=10141 RepID=UPI002FE01A85
MNEKFLSFSNESKVSASPLPRPWTRPPALPGAGRALRGAAAALAAPRATCADVTARRVRRGEEKNHLRTVSLQVVLLPSPTWRGVRAARPTFSVDLAQDKPERRKGPGPAAPPPQNRRERGRCGRQDPTTGAEARAPRVPRSLPWTKPTRRTTLDGMG